MDFNAEEPLAPCASYQWRTLDCQSVPEEWKSMLNCTLPFYPHPAQPKSTCSSLKEFVFRQSKIHHC